MRRSAPPHGAHAAHFAHRFSFFAPHLKLLDSDTSLEEMRDTSGGRGGDSCVCACVREKQSGARGAF